jgi:hypothetical protein
VRCDGFGYLNYSAWTYGSSKKIKENIVDIDISAIGKYLQCKPRNFDRKIGLKNDSGFIAEELVSVFPNFVQDCNLESEKISGNEAKLGITYSMFHAWHVKAFQEQQDMIDALVSRIEFIEKESGLYAK